jgi:hypothetical protein
MVMERKKYKILVYHLPECRRVHEIVGDAFMKLPNDEEIEVKVEVCIADFEVYLIFGDGKMLEQRFYIYPYEVTETASTNQDYSQLKLNLDEVRQNDEVTETESTNQDYSQLKLNLDDFLEEDDDDINPSNPYVYDGRMSLFDYELMHRNMKQPLSEPTLFAVDMVA